MKTVLMVLILFSIHAQSYRFLCNGIDADGNQESDSCGVCSDTTASRWSGNRVSYAVDTSVLPAGISSIDWTGVIEEAFLDWSSLEGVSLQTTNTMQPSRTFGTNASKHDIFWITNELEWMDAVGAGPRGILGVTLPLYNCPAQGTPFRRITDADMILNGVSSAEFNWAIQCDTLSDSCQSILATVSHELGHFLGLGHPAASSSALMSAIATFLVQYPQFDDQQGMRALYPASASGAYSTTCSSTVTCQSGLQCHTQGQNQFCSHACQVDSDCLGHLTCGSSNFCEFPSGTSIGAVELYDDCSQNHCTDNLTCVSIADSESYCYAQCRPDTGCENSDQTCHQLKNSKKEPINSWACMKFVAENEHCNAQAVCQKGLDCVAGVCVTDLGSIDIDNLDSMGGSLGGMSRYSSCSSIQGSSLEIWMLVFIMSIVVFRIRKKC